jgi:NAD(P)-dependent dehydrogenase (short-subunit alcohol dehydrogenase family)
MAWATSSPRIPAAAHKRETKIMTAMAKPKKQNRTREEAGVEHAGRAGNAYDIAAMVAFLISAAAGFITGQNFVIDCGMTGK